MLYSSDVSALACQRRARFSCVFTHTRDKITYTLILILFTVQVVYKSHVCIIYA